MSNECQCEFEEIYQIHEPNFEKILCQGDIFQSDIIKLQIENTESISGWIIVNATCDLVREGKTDFLKFIPIRPLNYYIKQNQEKEDKIRQQLDIILKYNSSKAFFLPPSDKFGDGMPHYAELGYITTLPVIMKFNELIEKLLKFRIASLKYPWREKLAESLGNNFHRIGVPDPPEKWKGWRDQSIKKCLEDK